MSDMIVGFVNPPFMARFSRESRSPAVTKSDTLYYPHWLCYAAAATSALDGVGVDVIDAAPTNIPVEQVIARLKAQNTKLVVFDTSTPSIYNDLRVADSIRSSIPGCIVAMAGPHVTATLKETFAYCDENQLNVDILLNGEYDHTVQQLSEAIRDGKDWHDLNGVAYQTDDGELVVKDQQPAITDLDSIPFVSSIYKRFFEIPTYFMSHTKYPMVTLISGRGCPYKCTFCQLPQVMYGHKYRTRSVENFVDEVEYIRKELPEVKGIMLEDDTFTADKPRVRAICKEMLKRGIEGIELTCNARANVDRETLDLMHQAGFRMMCVGFESGDQQTLNKMRKGTKQDNIQQFVKDAQESKVKVHGCFMYGNRDETFETMQKTLDLAMSMPIDSAQFYPIMLSPGTADYDYYKEKGMIFSEDFSKWNDDEGQHRSTVRRENITEKNIEDFCDYSRRKFYLRPKYFWMKGVESATSLHHLKKNLRGFRVLVEQATEKEPHNIVFYSAD